MRRFRRRRLATSLVLMVTAGCAVSPNPIRPGSLDEGFSIPDFLRPSVDLIESGPTITPAPSLDRPTGDGIQIHIRGVVLDASVSAAVAAECCDANQMVRWSTAWVPDVEDPDQVRRAAELLLGAIQRAERGGD